MKYVQLVEIIKNYDIMSRRSYLSAFLFQLEVFLERAKDILPNNEEDNGYKELTKHIIRELKMSKLDNEKARILYFPALVRNSMHMNGIHTEPTESGNISGVHFIFEEMKLVKHAGWRHVYFFCDKILEVVEEILRHDAIGKTPIPTYNPPPKMY